MLTAPTGRIRNTVFALCRNNVCARFLCTLLCCTNAAWALENPGAFGVPFEKPISAALLGASTDNAPATSLLPSITWPTDLGTPTPSGLDWRHFHPQKLPEPLRAGPGDYLLVTDLEQHPLWIVATVRIAQCSKTLEWLHGVFLKKYRLDTLVITRPPVAATTAADEAEPEASTLPPAFSESLSFSRSGLSVGAGCQTRSDGHQLQIEYRWQAAFSQALPELAQQQAQQAQQAAAGRAVLDQLGRARGVATATILAAGDQYKVEHVLGVFLGHAIKEAGTFEPDTPFPLPLKKVAVPFAGVMADAVLDPQGHLIRFSATAPDLDGAVFTRLKQAFTEVFQKPDKNTKRHIIYNVNSDHVVLRRRSNNVVVTVIDSSAQKEQAARRLAQQEQQWQAATEGI